MSDTVVTYVSRRAAGFRFSVQLEGETRKRQVACERGVITLHADKDAALIAAIDVALAANAALGQQLTKVDKEAAAQVAKNFSREMAAKGAFTSAQANIMRQQMLAASNAAIEAAAPNNPEALKQFAEEMAGENAVLTEATPPPKTAGLFGAK